VAWEIEKEKHYLLFFVAFICYRITDKLAEK